MGGWYTIGVFAGLGVALGVLVAGLLAPSAARVAVVIAAAAVAGGLLGLLLRDWPEGVAGAVGGALGTFGAADVARGALQRGGTRGATGALIALGAAVLAALAFVPVLGYLEAAVVPALGARLRRRGAERYAGLRILR